MYALQSIAIINCAVQFIMLLESHEWSLLLRECIAAIGIRTKGAREVMHPLFKRQSCVTDRIELVILLLNHFLQFQYRSIYFNKAVTLMKHSFQDRKLL